MKIKVNFSLVILIVLILVSGWIGRLIDANTNGADSPGMMIWLGMPFILVILWRSFTKKGWNNAGLKPEFKSNAINYLISIFLVPVIVFIIVQAARFSNAAWFYCPLLSDKGGYGGLIFTLILSGLVKNIVEESVWRGYFTAEFENTGFSRTSNHLFTGLIWGLWHLPYLGFVLSYIEESYVTLIPRFLLGTMAFSLLVGEIRLRSKSVIPAILLHTSAGVAIGLVYSETSILEFMQLQWLFSPGIEGLLMIIFMTGIGVTLVLKQKGE